MNNLLELPGLNKITAYNLDKIKNYKQIITAHQPVFWTPGYLSKFITAKYFAEKYNIKYKIIFHNLDVCKTLDCLIPSKLKKYFYINLHLTENEFIFYYKKIKIDDFYNFLGRIQIYLEKLDEKEIIENFIYYKSAIEEKLKNLKEIRIDDLMKKNLEIIFNNDMKAECLSDLYFSDEYKKYLNDLLENKEKLFVSYNEAIDEFYSKYNIKDKLFLGRKLEIYQGYKMLPLWFIKDNQRYYLYSKNNDLYIFNNKIAEKINLIQKDCFIIPKGILLGIFFRKYLNSFYIHGISGANYEKAGEIFIKNYFHIDIQQYGAVSVTFPLFEKKNDNKVFLFRNYPFFLYNIDKLKKQLTEYLGDI